MYKTQEYRSKLELTSLVHGPFHQRQLAVHQDSNRAHRRRPRGPGGRTTSAFFVDVAASCHHRHFHRQKRRSFSLSSTTPIARPPLGPIVAPPPCSRPSGWSPLIQKRGDVNHSTTTPGTRPARDQTSWPGTLANRKAINKSKGSANTAGGNKQHHFSCAVCLSITIVVC